MKVIKGIAVSERLGMGPKNAEVFVEDGRTFVRMYLDKTGWYVTYPLVCDVAELGRELEQVEAEESACQ